MKLFKVDVLQGTIEFLENEFGAIREFKAVMSKLRKVQGDSQGRYKLQNKRELLYIFFMADWTGANPYHSLTEVERHHKAVEAAGLERGYVPDEIVLDACNKYIELQQEMSPTTKILVSLKRNMQQSSNYFEGLAEENEKLINVKKSLTLELGGQTDATLLESISEINKMLQSNISAAQKFTVSLEQAIEKIDKLQDKARFEMTNSRRITGGGDLNNRELPSNREDISGNR
jgi:hypothetical protein